MIAFLRGEIADLTENSLILDVNGVGYEVLVPGQLLSVVEGIGQTIKIYTYMQVREDAVVLFGFLTRDDLQMFRMLTGVSGVGPKAGLNILSAVGADNLRFAILADDAKKIARTPGIGAKTAQKIILELKDKLAKGHAAGGGMESYGGSGVTIIPENKLSEASAALAVLGYSQAEINVALKGIDIESQSLEQVIRLALKNMVK